MCGVWCFQGYKVYYTMTPDLPITLWTLHAVDNSQLTTISNLLTNRTYTISVLALTSVGDGPLSEPIQVRTQQGGRHTTCIQNGLTDHIMVYCTVSSPKQTKLDVIETYIINVCTYLLMNYLRVIIYNF